MEEKAASKPVDPRDERFKDSFVTIPNVICLGRLIGSFVLIGFALAGWRYWFVGWFLILSFSDWIDGRLARWLRQRSDFGARLDSTADAVMYTALLAGLAVLSWDWIQQELAWLIVGVGSYAVTTGVGLWKYGRVPSYHTYGAKITQWIASIAGVCLALHWTVWPLRIAVIAVTLTNIEATAITCVLKKWQADVLTFFHVWPSSKQDSKEKPNGE